MLYDTLLNAGEEREHHHMGIHLGLQRERQMAVGSKDMMCAESKRDTGITQVRIIETLKSIESLCILFRCAISTQQMTIEVDTHLWYTCMSFLITSSSQFNTRQQVLLGIRTRLAYGQLTTRENDRFRYIS